ncbi:MAG TPA: hypothetical protein VE650_19880 [Acetobacteraceae bacterium]|nr:hypothetical protein [Acetobacteraceae bacterium]
MALMLDARVPVRLGTWGDVVPGDAVLVEGGAPGRDGLPMVRFELAGSEHPAGCACCLPRSPAALALNHLFQARARGEVAFFRRVVAVTVSPEGGMAVSAAVREDPLTSGRFRPDTA